MRVELRRVGFWPVTANGRVDKLDADGNAKAVAARKAGKKDSDRRAKVTREGARRRQAVGSTRARAGV